MRFASSAGLLLAIAGLAACAEVGPLDPIPAGQPNLAMAAAPAVWISEFHYDNASTDVGEFVELNGIPGTDLTDWRIMLYNGSNGAAYRTSTLTGTLTGCGVLVVEYPTDGIQNGSPDAIALVDNLGNVISFISYEGVMSGVGGPADGMVSEDVGVSETSSTPVGFSIQRGEGGIWLEPKAETRGACNGDAPGGPVDPPPPPAGGDVFISEFHYDNVSTDEGEAIEVTGPAGTDLSGWSIVLYNGGNSEPYGTLALTGVIADQCDGLGTVAFARSDLQNGSPDGFALVKPDNTVAEFLSYEGIISAASGPAVGMLSVDVGVAETSSTQVGFSIQKIGGTWQEPAANSFGSCNGGGTPPPTGATTLVINELMGDPVSAESASWGEWFEVYNYGTAPVNLQGWTIASGGSNQPAHTIGESVIVNAGSYVVLGRGGDSNRNGGVTIAYNYYDGANTIWLDNSDWLSLKDPAGVTVDSVAWTSLPKGATRGVRNATVDNANVNGSNWGYSTTTFGAGDYGTPNAANGTLSDTAPTPPTGGGGGGGTLNITGRTASDPALPVGFQDQLFSSGTAPFTWSTTTPSLASVDANGIVTALGAGNALIRVEDANGATGTFTLPTINATSGSASYQNHVEFGQPVDGSPADDFIVTRPEYIASYSSTRGTPNWVSYNLDASHFGSADRCDCFTNDPSLPSSYTVLTTADYTGAGSYAGYGIDRGHLARSFDRTSGSLDNATTYYFTNIIPQAADNNQGPWAILENEIGDRARSQNREVFVIAGVAGSNGTVKGEGKIVIPGFVWKVAVVLPRDEGVGDVQSASDVEVIAVMMPNVPGIRNTPWSTFTTTVYAIEQATGYDLLSALPDGIERELEGRPNRAPVASAGGPYTADEGSLLSLSAAGSSDPDGDSLSYLWTFPSGQTATGRDISTRFVQEGTYAVSLKVTDELGATAETTAAVTVLNVAPTISGVGSASILEGERYVVAGSFADPGAHTWSATVDYGDGSGLAPLPLNGKDFSLSHVYTTAGSFAVTVIISDGTTASTRSATVTVGSLQSFVTSISDKIETATDRGEIRRGASAALRAKLGPIYLAVARDRDRSASALLRTFILQVRTFVRVGQVDDGVGTELIADAERLLELI